MRAWLSSRRFHIDCSPTANPLRAGSLAASLLIACSMTAHAGEIPITNPGFESYDAYNSDGDIPGWTETSSYAAINPAAALYYNYQGGNVLDLNAPNNLSYNGQGQVYQTLGSSWSAGVYEMQLLVWEPYYGQTNNNGPEFGTYNGGVNVQLLDGTTQAVIGGVNWNPSDPNAHNIRFNIAVGGSNPAIGDPIEIVLTHTGNGDTWIDNLDLSSPPVNDIPEPGSLALLAAGIAGLTGRLRRKAQ